MDSIKKNNSLRETLDSGMTMDKFKLNEKLGLKHDSLKLNSKLNSKKDSLKRLAKEKAKLRKKDFTLHGNLSNQFDYGTVPYYLANASSPVSAFKSQGDVKFSLKSLPFIFNYFYANPTGLFGLQNYYTLRFDQETYQQNLQNECLAKKTVYQEKLKEVQKLKQDYEQKLAFCESMQSYSTTSMQGMQLDSGLLQANIPAVPEKPDTTGLSGQFLSKEDSVKYQQTAYVDSLMKRFNADTNYQKIKVYKEKIDLYDKQAKEYEQSIKFLESGQVDAPENPYLSKAKNFLGNVKKFEIGLCYPNYSTFLINNLALKGINVGYESKNYFVNATYGKTVNNLLNPTGNTNLINSFQNYSNFFDFNNNQDSRKILAGKVGIGNTAKSYLAFGALYGVGNQSYYQPTTVMEKNIVYELDGKVSFKGYVVSASFAKSFLNQATSNEEQNVLSKNRNNGIQLRFTGSIPYLKTKFSLGYRLVDPFFKSYGVGFIRTDNIRYEAKLEQNISSKVKLGLNYRHDEDNILKRYGFKSNLHFLSMSAKVKLLKKRLDVQLIYTPILQKIENLSTRMVTKNKSDMKNVVVAYTPKFKKFTTTFTGIYNQYTLYDSTALRNMENINLNILTIFRNSLKIGISSAYFDSNVKDSISTPKTLINSLETGYTFKKTIYTSLVLKHSYNFSSASHQYGAAANINFPLFKYVSMDLHAEKLIIGDFYNSLNMDNINKFPYYCYIKLNLKF